MRVQVGDADAIHLCQIHNPLSIVLYIDRRVYVYLEAAGVGVGVRTQHPERGGQKREGWLTCSIPRVPLVKSYALFLCPSKCRICKSAAVVDIVDNQFADVFLGCEASREKGPNRHPAGA